MSASEPPPVGGRAEVDLAAALANGALVISAETREDPAERDHRHQQEAADARLRRWKDAARFTLSAGLLLAIGGVALRFALDGTAAPDEKVWARTILAGLVSAVAGYFIGKQSKD